ncbi:hypothetical protein RclHR1_02590013 [Rhizophagus clarus]|uniref:Phosphatidylglycerol/phosphatidylinositol transfer protein n=1 Tax=Rhizophagus clarus TaxID=94130 RepID=A0A2Z6RUL0_9GLOM|nr:hypothetical protein RclHR1_02590013 [Rhizophagus clarus]GES93010.1 hypothetical protein GLOIN_2v1631297 [Rhizophagus clarus]
MKSFLNLIIVLLTVLSTINAFPHLLQKRVTKTIFSVCYDGSNLPIPPVNLKLNPDPIESEKSAHFKFSGTLQEDITDASRLRITFFDNDHNPIPDTTIIDICKKVECPIKAGDEFNLDQDVDAPKLPDSYNFVVEVWTQPAPPLEVIGCIAGYVPDSF